MHGRRCARRLIAEQPRSRLRQDRATVKRIRATRVMFFLLLATCGALCQSQGPSADLGLEYVGPDSHEVHRQELRTWKSLPDAPSAQPPTQAEKFRTFVDEARSPLTFGAAGVNAGIMRETELGRLSSGGQASLMSLYQGALIQKESGAFFSKYLYPALLKQDPRYHPSNSGSFLGRVTYAASRNSASRNSTFTCCSVNARGSFRSRGRLRTNLGARLSTTPPRYKKSKKHLSPTSALLN
jgi:hypothetical protein